MKLWSKVLQIFLLFSLYFSSLNLKYLKLTKMDITHFAMKLFKHCLIMNTALTFISICADKSVHKLIICNKVYQNNNVMPNDLYSISITQCQWDHKKSFIAKRVISILVNLRYLRFKLLKYKENNKKICNTFDHNFKNIPLYIMSNVSLERYYIVLYDGALTLKMSKMALNAFCDKTLHM